MTGAPIPDLHLPGNNMFIPERLDVEKFEVVEPAKQPELLRNSELSLLWYKRDDTFWLPKANVSVYLFSPVLNNTPRNAVLGRLFCDLFKDSIVEDIYDADMAELSFDLHYAGESIAVGAGGFSDKLAVLLETMLKRFANFEIDEKRFPEVVEDVSLCRGEQTDSRSECIGTILLWVNHTVKLATGMVMSKRRLSGRSRRN